MKTTSIPKLLLYSFMFVNLIPQIKDIGIPRPPASYRYTQKEDEVSCSQKIPFISMIIILVTVLVASKISSNRKKL